MLGSDFNSYIGRRVRTWFGTPYEDYFEGIVKSWRLHEDTQSSIILFFISYEDGDEDEITLQELQNVILPVHASAITLYPAQCAVQPGLLLDAKIRSHERELKSLKVPKNAATRLSTSPLHTEQVHIPRDQLSFSRHGSRCKAISS